MACAPSGCSESAKYFQPIHPTFGARTDALARENIPHFAACAARLIEKRKGLKPFRTKFSRDMKRTDIQISFAFIPDNKQGLSGSFTIRIRFLEAGIEIGEIRDVREMLAIGINDDVRQPAFGHMRAQGIEAPFEFGRRDRGRPVGRSEFRPIGFNQLERLGRTTHGNAPRHVNLLYQSGSDTANWRNVPRFVTAQPGPGMGVIPV